MVKINIILVSMIVIFCVTGNNGQEQTINNLAIGKLDCEGPESSNYTFIDIYQQNSKCEAGTRPPGTIYLISCSPTGERSVISTQVLARSVYPAGAYYQVDSLMLATSGPLAGKYIYIKWIKLVTAYLKKCSSVLGYSYILSKSLVILIANKLDVNMFTYPGGAYEPVKKASSTICHGQTYTV